MFLFVFITAPILSSIYGKKYFEYKGAIQGPADFNLTQVLPAIAIIAFWIYKSAHLEKWQFRQKLLMQKLGSSHPQHSLLGVISLILSQCFRCVWEWYG